MKKTLTLAICAGILSPFYASAQLITLGVEGATSIDSMVVAMNADVNELYSGASGNGGLSLASDIYWDSTLGWGVSANDTLGPDNDPNNYEMHFESFDMSSYSMFEMTSAFEIGYIGNESGDDNELLINSFSSQLGPLSDSITIWDYDSGDPNSVDDPPQSYTVLPGPSAIPPVYVQFAHLNVSQDGVVYATQDDTSRFNWWKESTDDADYYLFAISDRNDSFDGDVDDGFFIIKVPNRDLPPVPEPSQVAAMALLGLGALLFIRRRFARK